MNTLGTDSWHDANQQYISTVLGLLKLRLKGHDGREDNRADLETQTRTLQQRLQSISNEMSAPPALESLAALFGLSSFERDLVLLCAGVELDAEMATLCRGCADYRTAGRPTFSMALAVLADAHWSALIPNGPLRYWRLIEVQAGDHLTFNALRIDERILHYLTGVAYLDERLTQLMAARTERTVLVPSQQKMIEQAINIWAHPDGSSRLPAIQLIGRHAPTRLAAATQICRNLGLLAQVLPGFNIPQNGHELTAFARLWNRESLLSQIALVVDQETGDGEDRTQSAAIGRLLEEIPGPVLVCARDRFSLSRRPVMTFDIGMPTPQEQRRVWEKALGRRKHTLNGGLDPLLAQFNLDAFAIHTISARVLGETPAGRPGPAAPQDLSKRTSKAGGNGLNAALWRECRAQTQPHLENLAQKIMPKAGWDDLILPHPQKEILEELAIHARQRFKVHESWGFAQRCSHGLGISALFVGPSGTGKTMAAEVLANTLQLDLYRIDLSTVISKYIGETEKNLRRVFDAAEHGGALLLFDEADALFGRRSEVRDSHDRYANIEISYLLQRMEAYRGLTILTTNMKDALDKSFWRRIRFLVNFPFPDESAREQIWKCIFPDQTPLKDLNPQSLARLNVTGGSIRNIAMKAAFLAAEHNQPVDMAHVLKAARSEYLKLAKPLTDAEVGPLPDRWL